MISINLKKRIYTSILLFILFFLIISFNSILAYSLIVFGVFSFIEFTNLIKRTVKNNFYMFALNLLYAIYIFIFCLIFFIFSNFLQLKIILFVLLIGCIFSDIGGYVFGNIFKGPKLTKISPNKTISGALGSLIFTSLALSVSIFYFTKSFSFLILVIAILTSIGCQIGDLFFSFLKRKANIKDTGNFLPGHGGVLDRLDGILLGMPVGLMTLTLIY
jgi:phosphatidate cytidylyltransferase